MFDYPASRKKTALRLPANLLRDPRTADLALNCAALANETGTRYRGNYIWAMTYASAQVVGATVGTVALGVAFNDQSDADGTADKFAAIGFGVATAFTALAEAIDPSAKAERDRQQWRTTGSLILRASAELALGRAESAISTLSECEDAAHPPIKKVEPSLERLLEKVEAATKRAGSPAEAPTPPPTP